MKAETMQAGRVILDRIGENHLVSFAAREIRFGKSNRKTHHGYLEFIASDQPRIPEEVMVRVEWLPDDTCLVRVLDAAGKEEKSCSDEVHCEDLVDLLYEIFG